MSALRRHVRIACSRCRERKSKCDGHQPVCIQCQARGTVCDYSQSIDGRASNRPHRRIAELELEIVQLRKQLDEATANATLDQQTRSSTTLEQDKAQSRAAAGSSAARGSSLGLPTTSYSAVDSLHIDSRSGQVTFLGPTSIPPSNESGSKEVSPNGLQMLLGLVPDSPGLLNLSFAAHEELLHLFFFYLNGWSVFINEHDFREGLATSATSTYLDPLHSTYSPFLHLCILATSARLSQSSEVPPTANPATRGYPFLQAAIALLGSELEKPKPTTVFGLNLLTLNFSDMNKEPVGYILNGMAIRVSQTLGLHVDTAPLVSQGRLNAKVQQLRDNAYWSVRWEDLLVSLYAGRVPLMSGTDHELVLTSPLSSRLIDCRGTDETSKHAIGTLCNIASEVVRLFYSVRKDNQNEKERVLEIRVELQSWRQRFDPRLMSEPQAPLSSIAFTILAMQNTIVILLNRPFLQRQCLDTCEGQACFQAASDTAELMRMQHATHTMARGPVTNSQNMHVAGSFLLLLLADLYDSERYQTERSMGQVALDGIMSSLDSLSKSWGIAAQAHSALKSMRDEYAVGQGSTEPLDLESFWADLKMDCPTMSDVLSNVLEPFVFDPHIVVD